MVERQSTINQWSNNGPAIGTVLKSVSPTVAEALGHTPLDFLFVDRQHNTPIYQELEHVMRAADLNDMRVVIRIPKDDLSMVTYSLDIGAKGIMLPQVENSDIVEEALSHVHYDSGRSLSTASRAGGYGYEDRQGYIDHVDNDLTVLPQIESEAGVDTLEDIVILDEITDIAIGPGDLAYTMGETFGSDAHVAMIDRIYEIAGRHGCNVGTFVAPAALEQYYEQSSFLVCSSDVTMLLSKVEDRLSDLE